MDTTEPKPRATTPNESVSVDLADILSSCTEYATRGYQMAKKDLKSMRTVLEKAKDQVRQCSASLDKSKLDVDTIQASLKEQLKAISDSFDDLSNELQNDLVDKADRLSLFSVTLFGRTMAGKSTLMEVLCKGDGESIGKGMQRTTRDVRSYRWNGLEITDVPGIAAFDGEEDEQVAFAAARQADLILFLITDDSPQAAEAECLAEIRNLGKPIMGIMNVKVGIDPSVMKLSLRDLNAAFDLNRLNGIRRQFLAFASSYGQDWHDIFFIFTHLKSAFLSQQAEYSSYANELWRQSRFSKVEQAIIREVRTRGQFLRIKTFIDAVAKPSVDVFNMLVEQSMENSEGGRTIISKYKKLKEWRQKYIDDCNNRIDGFCDRLRSKLISLIPNFVEEHYSDSRAGKSWEKLVRDQSIENQCKKLFSSLADECDHELQEIAREIENEMSFSALNFSASRSIRMDLLIDGRRIARWGLSLGGGILTIGGLITGTLAGPVGWIAAALGVAAIFVPNLFEDHGKTVAEAKQKLTRILMADVEKIVKPVETQLKKALQQDLIDNCVTKAEHNISSAVDTVFSLSQTQRELAGHLNLQLKEINRGLIVEALQHIEATGIEYHFDDIARLPGEYILIEVDASKSIPSDIVKKLEDILQERILFVRHQEGDSPKTLIGRILRQSKSDLDWSKISVEEKPRLVHVPIDELSPYGIKLKALAQQLTDYLITE